MITVHYVGTFIMLSGQSCKTDFFEYFCVASATKKVQIIFIDWKIYCLQIRLVSLLIKKLILFFKKCSNVASIILKAANRLKTCEIVSVRFYGHWPRMDSNLCFVVLVVFRVSLLIVKIPLFLWNLKCFIEAVAHSFKNPRPLFHLFSVFFKQTSIQFYNKLMWKMSIQYMALGFEPTTLISWVSSHNP